MSTNYETQFILESIKMEEDAMSSITLNGTGALTQIDCGVSEERAVRLLVERLRDYVAKCMLGRCSDIYPIGAELFDRFLERVDFEHIAHFALARAEAKYPSLARPALSTVA